MSDESNEERVTPRAPAAPTTPRPTDAPTASDAPTNGNDAPNGNGTPTQRPDAPRPNNGSGNFNGPRPNNGNGNFNGPRPNNGSGNFNGPRPNNGGYNGGGPNNNNNNAPRPNSGYGAPNGSYGGNPTRPPAGGPNGNGGRPSNINGPSAPGAPIAPNRPPMGGGVGAPPRPGGFNGPRPGGQSGGPSTFNGPRPGGGFNGPRPGGGFNGPPSGPGAPPSAPGNFGPAPRPGGGGGGYAGPGGRPGPGGGRPSGPGGPGGGRPGVGGAGGGRPSGVPGAGGRPGARGGRSGGRSRGPVVPVPGSRAAASKPKVTGPITLPSTMLVKDLAEMLDSTPNEIIVKLIGQGVFANINQVIDYKMASTVATEFGFEPTETVGSAAPTAVKDEAITSRTAAQPLENRLERPPVVTVMGHVDHGKTSLLDAIRKTKVAAGEAGGITQHIGAYQVKTTGGRAVTFLDTPGHEAFTAMRARGAKVGDIAILVVAADDGVMPQTIEAIDHARAAQVPIVVALNKIDKPNANPDNVKQQLAEHNVIIEEYGGEVICAPVSAKKGEGIEELLEMILLVADVQDLKANPSSPAVGTVLEARIDKNTGVVANILVQDGTLKIGDIIVVGTASAKVRAMLSDTGERIREAGPSTPVSLMGLAAVPDAGDHFIAVTSEREARQLIEKHREDDVTALATANSISLDMLYQQMQQGKIKELNLLIKADVQGSLDALRHQLSKLSTDQFKVRLIHEGVGNISETDVHLASASKAIIIGFNTKPDGAAQRVAQNDHVDIRFYDVIYKLVDDIDAALKGMLEPVYKEVVEGHAEVLQLFKAGKIIIGGCKVTDGKIARSATAKVVRGGKAIFTGKFGTLRRGKDDAREVATGFECGLTIDEFNDLQIGDIIETTIRVRV